MEIFELETGYPFADSLSLFLYCQSSYQSSNTLQQEVLPKAFRSLVDDLESEAETQRLLMEQVSNVFLSPYFDF